MPTPLPVSAPAGYAPVTAIGFVQPDSTLTQVTAASPLPVSVTGAEPSAALTGSTPASVIAGPFAPVRDRPVVLALSGTWTGSVKVLRSTDNGATKLPLTVGGTPWATFSANCCEAVWEESANGVQLFLDVTLSAGTLTYRLEQ